MRMGHPGLRCLLGHVAAHQLGNYVVGTVDRHPRRSEDAAATGQATDRRAGRHRGGRRPRGRVVSVVEPAGLDRSQQELFGMAGRWLRRGRTGRSASRTTLRPRPLRRGRCRVRWRANPTCRSTSSQNPGRRSLLPETTRCSLVSEKLRHRDLMGDRSGPPGSHPLPMRCQRRLHLCLLQQLCGCMTLHRLESPQFGEGNDRRRLPAEVDHLIRTQVAVWLSGQPDTLPGLSDIHMTTRSRRATP